MAEKQIKREARAKINLFLRVLGLREDGYHDLETLIAPISLADEITCTQAEGLKLQVETSAIRPGDDPISEGPDNLVVVAALALAEARPAGFGAEITLTKHIPVAAGLGGGSADAAATLIALNELWECQMNEEALMQIGALVGSDVPAMLAGEPVFAKGRGVKLETVSVPKMWWVIVPAEFPIRTPDAYRWWDEDADSAPTGPDPSTLIASLSAEGATAADIARDLFNDLEAPVFRRHPELAETKRRLLEAGALAAIMCGSGPTMAGLAAGEEEARELATKTNSSLVVSSSG